MGTDLLEENIPRLKVFSLVGRLCFELFHSLIAREGRMIDSSHKCPQGGIIVKSTQLLSDLDNFFDLFRPCLCLVVT